MRPYCGKSRSMTARERVIEEQQIWLRLLFSQASLAVKALREAGIPCLMLKGGAGLLAGWLKAEDRPVTDIDVLISPERLGRGGAHSYSKGAGARPFDPIFPVTPGDIRAR